ncbi:MAG: bifunctional diguanylate cyclase/phosphodiesterase [Alphaproteobacteria bacterium]|jgi:diguanylate cyclase (GGDEF)-like protein|nr:bifunctional diguanylate cyclase/phosphodiesterase [Alphaproteobacteria bacterium]
MTDSFENLIAANEALKDEVAKRVSDLERTQSIAQISEENPNPVLRVSNTGEILYANQSSDVLLSQWQVEVGGCLPLEWCAVVDEALRGKTLEDREMACQDRWFSITVQPVVDAGYTNIFGRDITKDKEAEEIIVNFDDLTGLPNRALFQDRLQQVLGHARRAGKLAAVHLINLDHFKEVNESMGREAGDALLKGIANRFKDCVRTSDTVARLGGDEFGVIQVDPVNSDGVAVLAQKLLKCLEAPFEIDGRKVYSGASVGITVFPDDAGSPDDVLRNADLALSNGKGDDRGNFRFYVAQMNEDIQRRRSIEDDMRESLVNGDFVLHYQPKLNITTNRITGMEALVRWNHPEKGFMSPAEFIPVAERSKLIIPLGEWVLREACRHNKALTDAGLGPIKVAVNLSAEQFRAEGLVETVTSILDETCLDAKQLELEITESLAMHNADVSIDLCGALEEHGISLSIDDFGTGYSSLSYLKNFPVQRIKIDKAFVDDINDEENCGVIARAVTTLGHSFGMEITAEGVETEDQLNFLRALKCDEIQGYYFSRPLPGDELEEFLRNFEDTWAITLDQERRGGTFDRRQTEKVRSSL